MKKRTPVSKIMTTDIISVNKTQSLKEVSEIIETKHIRHVPVTSGDEIIGMLSKTDLNKISFINAIEGDELTSSIYDYLTIEQVMTKNIATVQVNDIIYDVATSYPEVIFMQYPY
jgi:predicted transcriptional regulator